MKYIIYSVLALALTAGLAFGITGLIRKRLKKKPPLFLHCIISLLLMTVISAGTAAVYVSIHYPADEDALNTFSGAGAPALRETEGAYFIDGPGEDTALVFYPGAKVDPEAYFPLMKKIAEKGIDCFVVRPPFRLAIFDPDAAGRIIDKYKYQRWIVSGHSMGGVCAASFAAGDPDRTDGVVLLAAYPGSQMDKSIRLLSIYGSEDMVLDRDQYNNSRSLFPPDYREIVIKGGNHSGFGNYGEQRGDGTALISRKKQQEQTAEAIAGSFLKTPGKTIILPGKDSSCFSRKFKNHLWSEGHKWFFYKNLQMNKRVNVKAGF